MGLGNDICAEMVNDPNWEVSPFSPFIAPEVLFFFKFKKKKKN
jgi:hypothetical protein